MTRWKKEPQPKPPPILKGQLEMPLFEDAPSSSQKVNKDIRGGKTSSSKRKEDALELARLVYDVFIEERASGNINNGQNNAQSSDS